MHAKCWYGSESGLDSAVEGGLALRSSQRTRWGWGELYPLLPQPWIEDKKAWFKLELQSDSNPPGAWRTGSDSYPLLFLSDLRVRPYCATLLSYCSLWMWGDGGWHRSRLVSGAALQQAVKADAKKPPPAPTLGQPGVSLSELYWFNAHWSVHIRQ